jgi:DNA-binding transcriptional MerR regulator/methylmalonyl-CoA mutase cobalamin-binding subunit
MYTIKAASARTGIPVAVLRAWERRYRIVEPSRTPSGYRLYDEAALTRLTSMRDLIEQGWTPSSAASALLAGTAPEAPRVRAEERSNLDVERTLREAFVFAAGSLDEPGVERALDEMFARGSFESAVEREVLPALVALGDAWADGRVDVAAEHAASHAVLRRFAAAFEAAARTDAATGAVLVGLPPGSHHELGALAFAVAARRAGLPVLYLGADLPAEDWVATARRTRARAVVIGVVGRRDRGAALEVARAVRRSSPEVVIALGGRAAADVAADAGPGVLVLGDGLREPVDQMRSALS